LASSKANLSALISFWELFVFVDPFVAVGVRAETPSGFESVPVSDRTDRDAAAAAD
jgi:hypothetical protein